MRLVFPPTSFFCREDLQAGRPPARLDCFDERLWQVFGFHFMGEGVVIVFEGDVGGAGGIENRVADASGAVVGGATEDAAIDERPILRERPHPGKTRVRRNKNVTVM